MKVTLLGVSSNPPLGMAEFSGKTCYQDEMPGLINEEENAKKFVQNKLFFVSHHTTLEHTNFTFFLENIPVSDVTLGLHLTHPFYNSDQRSGRYCAKMFINPDYISIRAHILSLWPECTPTQVENVLGFIKLGTEIYSSHISEAIATTAKLFRQERPDLNEEVIADRAPKIAQEQLRVFISTIFPTGLVHTIDLVTLVSLWESAWSPGMRKITEMMKERILEKYPQIAFMFDHNRRRKDDWVCRWPLILPKEMLVLNPKVEDVNFQDLMEFKSPEETDMHPVDKLHFLPERMENNIGMISYRARISLTTMGQDQRHRTVRRGEPIFTGQFYLTPICQELRMEKIAKSFFSYYCDLRDSIPVSLFSAIAPYGTVVTYKKTSTFNAWLHESAKRFCWQAQEEIYNLNVLLKDAILSLSKNKESNHTKEGVKKIIAKMIPPCFHSGACAEGVRYCGRDLKCRESKFRKV